MNRKDVTNKIITALENGVCPWRQTWAALPHKNQFSGKFYRGMNQILLSLNLDYVPYWATFMQWKELGCSVQKGQRASQVVFFSVIEKEENNWNDDSETPKFRSFPLLRYYNVFHLKQVDDPKNKFQHLIDTKINADYDSAQKIIDTSGAKIRNGGNRACYTLPGNYIKIPFKKQFESEEEYLVTVFHELGHWADHNIFGTEMYGDHETTEYAYQELVAELTACFLCRACQIPNDFKQHENYIGSWIKGMKNDVGYIWRASRDASKIADHLLKKAGIITEENDAENEIENDDDDVTE
jgi:antirestriction protein ArdC